MEDSQATIISSCLPRLERLDLSNNLITYAGADDLADLEKLKYLNLSKNWNKTDHNNIEDSGAIALVDMLLELKELHMSNS